MIWLTWRQSRFSVLVTGVALVGIALALAITHPVTAGFFSHNHLLQFFSTFLVAVPALFGAFLGAPLVAGELESGTYRLAWTQSVTRAHWLAVKVGLIGLLSVTVTELLALVLTWSSSATVNQGRFGSAMFAERGIVPIGYASFGFALGVTAGMLIRRTLPAMAATLVVFLAARIVVQSLVRPHFATPLKVSSALQGNGLPLQARPGDWTMSNDIVSPAGHVVNNLRCDSPTCMAGYRQLLTLQPASRYWTFQSYETALFVGVGLALIAFCFWWTRRRLS